MVESVKHWNGEDWTKWQKKNSILAFKECTNSVLKKQKTGYLKKKELNEQFGQTYSVITQRMSIKLLRFQH